ELLTEEIERIGQIVERTEAFDAQSLPSNKGYRGDNFLETHVTYRHPFPKLGHARPRGSVAQTFLFNKSSYREYPALSSMVVLRGLRTEATDFMPAGCYGISLRRIESGWGRMKIANWENKDIVNCVLAKHASV
ncbi:11477_t:CDS:2, partial [Paraglomus brasilianum]